MRIAHLFAGALGLFVALGCSRGKTGGTGTLSAAGFEWQIVTGTWEAQGDALTGAGGNIYTTTEVGDGTLDVDVETVQKAGGPRTVGVGFRGTFDGGDVTKPNGYGFNFTGDRTFNVFRGAKNAWFPLDPKRPTFQPLPALVDGKNHIRVKMTGANFDVTVNDQPAATMTDATPYPRGRLFFWVESSAEKVKFTNIRFKKD